MKASYKTVLSVKKSTSHIGVRRYSLVGRVKEISIMVIFNFLGGKKSGEPLSHS